MADKIYEVVEYHLLTPQVAQIFLHHHSDAPLQYEAGQYIKIVNPDQTTSPFSIANAPEDFFKVELHLLFIKDNRRALDILSRVKTEKALTLRGPYGSSTANRLVKNKPIIFIAKGTGFSPIKAVIESLSQRPVYPAMHLYWTVPGWHDLYLQGLIHHWMDKIKDFRFTAVLTRETQSGDARVKFGNVAEFVLQDYPDLSDYQVYASGPQGMIYSALDIFQLHGLTRKHFFSDVFDYQS